MRRGAKKLSQKKDRDGQLLYEKLNHLSTSEPQVWYTSQRITATSISKGGRKPHTLLKRVSTDSIFLKKK